MQLANLA